MIKMKLYTKLSLGLIFTLSFVLAAVGSPANMASGPELDAELTARAKELVPMLSDHFCVLPGIEDRAFWEGGVMASQGPNLVRQAEKDLKEPVMQLPDELYLEFSQNGNRTNYQNAHGRRNAPLGRFVLAECYENKGRFIPRIEEHLRAYFADKSWTLPAHDSSLNDFYGKETIIDLVSSDKDVGARVILDDVTEKDLERVKVLRLVDDPFLLPVCLIYKKGRTLSMQERYFSHLVVDAFRHEG